MRTNGHRRAFFVSCMFSFALVMPSEGSEQWSFADNPHPRYDALNSAEKAIIEEAVDGSVRANACASWLDAEYALYQQFYPDFIANGENARLWKRHLSWDTSGTFSSCLSYVPWIALVEADPVSSDFYFCGQYSRAPNGQGEQYLAKMIDELFVYAQSASGPSVDFLLSANDMTEIVDLNPEIDYYFRLLVKPELRGEQPLREVDDLLPLIGASQQSVIEAAVERRELKDVLTLSGGCVAR